MAGLCLAGASVGSVPELAAAQEPGPETISEFVNRSALATEAGRAIQQEIDQLDDQQTDALLASRVDSRSIAWSQTLIAEYDRIIAAQEVMLELARSKHAEYRAARDQQDTAVIALLDLISNRLPVDAGSTPGEVSRTDRVSLFRHMIEDPQIARADLLVQLHNEVLNELNRGRSRQQNRLGHFPDNWTDPVVASLPGASAAEGLHREIVSPDLEEQPINFFLRFEYDQAIETFDDAIELLAEMNPTPQPPQFPRERPVCATQGCPEQSPSVLASLRWSPFLSYQGYRHLQTSESRTISSVELSRTGRPAVHGEAADLLDQLDDALTEYANEAQVRQTERLAERRTLASRQQLAASEAENRAETMQRSLTSRRALAMDNQSELRILQSETLALADEVAPFLAIHRQIESDLPVWAATSFAPQRINVSRDAHRHGMFPDLTDLLYPATRLLSMVNAQAHIVRFHDDVRFANEVRRIEIIVFGDLQAIGREGDRFILLDVGRRLTATDYEFTPEEVAMLEFYWETPPSASAPVPVFDHNVPPIDISVEGSPVGAALTQWRQCLRRNSTEVCRSRFLN